jgi:hypothetical protein
LQHPQSSTTLAHSCGLLFRQRRDPRFDYLDFVPYRNEAPAGERVKRKNQKTDILGKQEQNALSERGSAASLTGERPKARTANQRRLCAIFLARNKLPMTNTVRVNHNGPSFSPTTELQTRKTSSSNNSSWTILTMIMASSSPIRGPGCGAQRWCHRWFADRSILSLERNYSISHERQMHGFFRPVPR